MKNKIKNIKELLTFKKHEKETFIKSFLIFFISLEVLLSITFFLYYKDKKDNFEQKIFLEMKNYNYTLIGDEFAIDIVPFTNEAKTYTFIKTKDSVESYFPIMGGRDSLLKISYSYEKYIVKLDEIRFEILGYFLLISFIISLYSVFYSIYSIRPLANAYNLLEEFLKDIIHDLNTPITSILLNVKMLRKTKEEKFMDRIEQSAKGIHSLHGNLQNYLYSIPTQNEEFRVDLLIKERVFFYKNLYPSLKFEENLYEQTLLTNKNAVQRIFDNIISNACKYNKSNGFVKIYSLKNNIIIEDSGIGIKQLDKIFNRFYKENERGLGIGLHIVKKLADELGINIDIKSSENGTVFSLDIKRVKYENS